MNLSSCEIKCAAQVHHALGLHHACIDARFEQMPCVCAARACANARHLFRATFRVSPTPHELLEDRARRASTRDEHDAEERQARAEMIVLLCSVGDGSDGAWSASASAWRRHAARGASCSDCARMRRAREACAPVRKGACLDAGDAEEGVHVLDREARAPDAPAPTDVVRRVVHDLANLVLASARGEQGGGPKSREGGCEYAYVGAVAV
eukprot:2267981-Pleurochrysis_carterae.AAC.1